MEEQVARAQPQRNSPNRDEEQMIGEENPTSGPRLLNVSLPEGPLTPSDLQHMDQYHHDQHKYVDSSVAEPVLTDETELHKKHRVQISNPSSSSLQPLSRSKSPTTTSVDATKWNAVAVNASQSAAFMRALAALTQAVPESGDDNERSGADTIPLFVRQAASNALKSLKESSARTSSSDAIASMCKSLPNPPHSRNPSCKPTDNSSGREPYEQEASVSLGNDAMQSGFVHEEVTTAAAVDGIGAVCEALVCLLQDRQQQNDRKLIVSWMFRLEAMEGKCLSCSANIYN